MKIFKFFLTKEENFIPAGSKILTVDLQHSVPVAWAMIPKHPRENGEGDIPIIAVVTGAEVGCPPEHYYKTLQIDGGDFIWHIFIDPQHIAKSPCRVMI